MRGILYLILILTAGCAAKTVQVDRLLRTPLPISEQQEIAGVPFIEQSAGHCGPATLAMTMAWAGQPPGPPSSQEDLYRSEGLGAKG